MTVMKDDIKNYLVNFKQSFSEKNFAQIYEFCNLVENTILNQNNIFICGNGGSAANSLHMANDFNLVLLKKNKYKCYVDSLSSNQSIISCIANDFGYENIFSEQLKIRAKKNDLLICLSGSGNSKNIIKAIEISLKMNLNIFSILGFNGGEAKKLSKKYFHIEINDMQYSEDAQNIINHVCAKWLLHKL